MSYVFIRIKTNIRFNKWQGIDFVTDAKTTEGERGSSAQKTQKSEGDKTSVSAFGSITAQLMDGMTLALSQFGATGESKDGKPSILVILYLQEALIYKLKPFKLYPGYFMFLVNARIENQICYQEIIKKHK